MRKAVWSVVGALACFGACLVYVAYAQLDTEVINATAVVAARGRITLTGAINFPDTDPSRTRPSTRRRSRCRRWPGWRWAPAFR